MYHPTRSSKLRRTRPDDRFQSLGRAATKWILCHIFTMKICRAISYTLLPHIVLTGCCFQDIFEFFCKSCVWGRRIINITGLHKALSDVGLGVWVLGRRVPLLLYADDIVLLAVEPQAMLDVVTVYAQQWRFELNHRKSNVVVMGTSAQKLQSAGWVRGGRQLEVINEYKYLGAESGKLSGAAGRWNSLLLRLHGKAQRALAALLYQCGGSNGLRPRTAVAHWKSSVRPVCEYA